MKFQWIDAKLSCALVNKRLRRELVGRKADPAQRGDTNAAVDREMFGQTISNGIGRKLRAHQRDHVSLLEWAMISAGVLEHADVVGRDPMMPRRQFAVLVEARLNAVRRHRP